VSWCVCVCVCVALLSGQIVVLSSLIDVINFFQTIGPVSSDLLIGNRCKRTYRL
jgi:hypothetical protein